MAAAYRDETLFTRKSVRGADWIALRIQQWIHQGKLEVLSTPDPDQFQYQQTLRKLGW